MLFIVLFIIIIFTTIAIFTFPQFSPIPYFPTNNKDLLLIIKALNLKNNQTVFDLGAGDGAVIFEAANEAFKRKLNTQFVAVEINPVLLVILFLRRLLNPNRENIKIVFANMFNVDYKKLLTFNFSLFTFYLYISPWHLEKTVANIKRQFKHFSVVSYMYEIKSLKLAKKMKGKKHPTFVYNI